jgi:hypothetical protein
VTLAGPLPPALQNATTYAAAPLARRPAADAAAAYVRYLATPAAVARFRALGFAARPNRRAFLRLRVDRTWSRSRPSQLLSRSCRIHRL